MIHWATQHVSASLATSQLPMEDVSKPTVKLTNGVQNAGLNSLFVSNVKSMLTESLSSQNTIVSALTDSTKLPINAINARADVLSAHQPPIALPVSV
jgi:hypothetical protein